MNTDIPLHQLTNNQTKLWLAGGDLRQNIAQNVILTYPAGCGIVAWRGQLIAYVAPGGRVRELAPPFHRIFRREVANKPAATACACGDWFDPEVGGPWRERGTSDHHPFCQFDQTSHQVFDGMMHKSTTEGTAYPRPDEHLRERERALGLRGEKTGARRG